LATDAISGAASEGLVQDVNDGREPELENLKSKKLFN